MSPSLPDAPRASVTRSREWHGVVFGDAVVVNTQKERRQNWTFVAHARNDVTGEEWVEVRGGRRGEFKGRSFRPDLIYPTHSRKGSRILGPSFATAPRLTLR